MPLRRTEFYLSLRFCTFWFAVHRRFRICHAKRRSLITAFGSAHSVLNVDTLVHCEPFAVHHSFRICYSKAGRLSQPSVLYFLVLTSTISAWARYALYSAVSVPATPNDGILPRPSVLHFLTLTFGIFSGACCEQYCAVLVPGKPNDGCLPQP